MARTIIFLLIMLPAQHLFAGRYSSNNMPYPQQDTVYFTPGILQQTARLYSDKDNASSVVMYVPAD